MERETEGGSWEVMWVCQWMMVYATGFRFQWYIGCNVVASQALHLWQRVIHSDGEATTTTTTTNGTYNIMKLSVDADVATATAYNAAVNIVCVSVSSCFFFLFFLISSGILFMLYRFVSFYVTHFRCACLYLDAISLFVYKMHLRDHICLRCARKREKLNDKT